MMTRTRLAVILVLLAECISCTFASLPQVESDLKKLEKDISSVKTALKPIVSAHDKEIATQSFASVGEEPLADCTDGHPTKRPGEENLSLTLEECKALPLEYHVARSQDVEFCLPDGADGEPGSATDRVRKYMSPTATSACEFEIVHRWHDRTGKRDIEAMLAIPKFDDTKVFVIVRESDGHLGGDWLRTNFKLAQKRVKVKRVKVGRVHVGFHEAWTNLERHGDIYAKIRQYVANGRKNFVFGGHSLGGAVATVGALYTRINVPDVVIDFVSSGAPRVGNRKFVRLFEELIRSSKRYVAKFKCNGRMYSDIVTTVPPRNMFQSFGLRGSTTLLQLGWGAQAASRATEAKTTEVEAHGADTADTVATAETDTDGSDADADAEDVAEDREAAKEEAQDVDDNGDTDAEQVDEEDGEENGGGKKGEKSKKSKKGVLRRAGGWLAGQIIGTASGVIHRTLLAGVSAFTSYRHVDGLIVIDSGLTYDSCHNHAAAILKSFSAHSTYRHQILGKFLPEYLATIRAVEEK